jgi:hypothetical protein
MIGDVKNISATKPVQVDQYDVSSHSSADDSEGFSKRERFVNR